MSMNFVIRHAAQLLAVSQTRESVKRGQAMREVAVIEDGALRVRDGRIDWVGKTSDLPPASSDEQIVEAVD